MQSNQPFFTNDATGVIKLITALGAFAGLLIAVIVKWGQSGFSKRLDKVESDVDGIGNKADGVKTDCIQAATKHDELRARMDRREGVIDAMLHDVGELVAGQRLLERADTNLSRDIQTFIVTALKERDDKIEQMGKEIVDIRATIREREASRALLKEILDRTGGSSK